MATLQHAYQYLTPSTLSIDGRHKLALATSRIDSGPHPYFFEGQLKYPRLSADLLTAVSTVVGSRFFTPINTLIALGAFDPVVTSGGGLLRFEGFSACCSAYVRVDMLPDSYYGDIVGKGTTNVDFNPAMRAALARVRDAGGLAFAVGCDEFAIRSGPDAVVEKKVELPLRWVRGMLEVQSYQSTMSKCFEVSGQEALRFIRTLPKSSTARTPFWVVLGPFGMRFTTVAADAAVRLVDVTRLRVLEPLLQRAQSVAIYADESQQASSWVLMFSGCRLTLTLSAEVWRGFSGEGQALHALMRASSTPVMSQVRAQLHWQAALRVEQLATDLSVGEQDVGDALRILGASGLVGYDVVEGAYFHRVLPFDLHLIDDMHPRLAGARALLEQGAVKMIRARPLEAFVASEDIAHHVREVHSELHCTCPWFAKHQGQRGPCKHILAVQACTNIDSQTESSQ